MSQIKKHVRMSIFLSIILLASGILKTGIAQKTKIDVNALTAETQKMSDKPDAMTMIWWVPEEFWLGCAAQDPTFTEALVKETIKTLQPYTLFAVIEGKIGTFGGVKYKSESSIRSKILLVGTNGIRYRPIGKDKIEANARNLVSMLKPVLANMLGEMGENVNFFLFPAQDKQGQNIAKANKRGIISFLLGNEEYRWRLPLSSLLPPKFCPNCREKCKGAWEYCPWCGTKLNKIKK
jgi:hypothetical protein